MNNWENKLAEELREEGETTHSEEVIETKEMEAMKEAEERFWKEENLMTERDLEIARTDIPERIQLEGSNDYDKIFTRYIYDI